MTAPATRLKVFFAFMSYGGNGGINSIHPSLRDWFGRTLLAMKDDPRVAGFDCQDFSDTPITMTRNAAVLAARKAGAHVIVMLDNDNQPDLLVGKDPSAKPFWNTSFDFLHGHYGKGPCLIFCPYCGPPPQENVYAGRWANQESGHAQPDFSIQHYSREEAAVMAGIQPAAAGPTGVIMFDMRCFDLTDPKLAIENLVNQGTHPAHARRLVRPWFYYEYRDIYESEKASTEDMTATRDIGMFVQLQLGYNPVFCNWDSWAGHWKPKCVGKPTPISIDSIGHKYQQAVLDNIREGETRRHVDIDPIMRRFMDGPVVNGKQVQEVVGFTTYEADLDALKRVITNAIRGGRWQKLSIAEIGCWVGASALAIANAVYAVRPTTGMFDLYCIDTWEGSKTDQTEQLCQMHGGSEALFKTFEKNTESIKQSLRIIRQKSPDAASHFENNSLDIIYIDADHSYEAVFADLQAWWPKLKDGGTICGHDWTSPGFPTVQLAVRNFFSTLWKSAPLGIQSDGNVWYVHKPEAVNADSDGDQSLCVQKSESGRTSREHPDH